MLGHGSHLVGNLLVVLDLLSLLSLGWGLLRALRLTWLIGRGTGPWGHLLALRLAALVVAMNCTDASSSSGAVLVLQLRSGTLRGNTTGTTLHTRILRHVAGVGRRHAGVSKAWLLFDDRLLLHCLLVVHLLAIVILGRARKAIGQRGRLRIGSRLWA